LEATVGDLYIGHLAALHAIISLSKDSTDPITSSQAYPAYVVACNDIGIAPVAREPGFRKIVEALADKELIRTEREGRTIEIRPLIDSAGAAIVTDRFNNLKERAQTPPTLLSDEEIRALLPDAPAQQLTLITIHHLLRETRKSQVLMSEVYQTYSELCRKKGGTPKNERDFKQVIAALEKGGYIQVQRGRVGKKPANRIKPCEGM
jgi:Cdc6-like AAA superfamily ATPase